MEDNICEKCRNMIVLWAFSTGECENCNEEVVTAHTPCYVLCDSCAEELHKCKQCGNDVKLS